MWLLLGVCLPLCMSLCPFVCLCLSLSHTLRVENVKVVENIHRVFSDLMSLGSDLTAYQDATPWHANQNYRWGSKSKNDSLYHSEVNHKCFIKCRKVGSPVRNRLILHPCVASSWIVLMKPWGPLLLHANSQNKSCWHRGQPLCCKVTLRWNIKMISTFFFFCHIYGKSYNRLDN